jgi:hypothetical protein
MYVLPVQFQERCIASTIQVRLEEKRLYMGILKEMPWWNEQITASKYGLHVEEPDIDIIQGGPKRIYVFQTDIFSKL